MEDRRRGARHEGHPEVFHGGGVSSHFGQSPGVVFVVEVGHRVQLSPAQKLLRGLLAAADIPQDASEVPASDCGLRPEGHGGLEVSDRLGEHSMLAKEGPKPQVVPEVPGMSLLKFLEEFQTLSKRFVLVTHVHLEREQGNHGGVISRHRRDEIF